MRRMRGPTTSSMPGRGRQRLVHCSAGWAGMANYARWVKGGRYADMAGLVQSSARLSLVSHPRQTLEGYAEHTHFVSRR